MIILKILLKIFIQIQKLVLKYFKYFLIIQILEFK